MFDYIPERPLDPPEDKVFAECDYCGGEIYEGETYYAINGKSIHTDCLRDFASDYFADCIEVASAHEYFRAHMGAYWADKRDW